MNSSELQCYQQNYPMDLSGMTAAQLQNHWTTIGANQGRNNQCPSQQQSSSLYDYKGCYNDTSNRAIPTFQGNVSNIDACEKIAEDNKQYIFGLQYGGQCFTGLNENDAYQYGAQFNKNSCPTNGGTWTNQVYVRNQTTNPFPPPLPNLTTNNFTLNENFLNKLEEEDNENTKNKLMCVMSIVFIILLFILFLFFIKK
jgi:hypothetical protein